MYKRAHIITALLLTIINSSSIAETKIHISTGFTPPVSDFYKSILIEADKRIKDISISFEVLPAERSLVLANEGINDGECCRFPAVVVSQYQNILPVNESFFNVRFSAFSKTDKPDITSFEDLKAYSVGTVIGWKIAVIKINEIKPQQTHIVATPKQMFTMLDQDRIDYGVVGYLSGLDSISSLKLNNIKAIDPPLVEKPLYLLLHKKHKKLIPIFDKTFIAMKNDGTIDKLYNSLVKSFE